MDIVAAGASLGSVLAAPFIASLYIAFGWRITFVGIAALGILWLIPWLFINKTTPDKHPWITEDEQAYILSDVTLNPFTQPSQAYTWKQLLRFRNTWGILSSRFFIDPVWWLFVTWLPTFLKEQFHFDIKQVGAFAWVPYLFAAIGGLLGGYFASQKIKHGIAAALLVSKPLLLAVLLCLHRLLPLLSILNR